MNNSEHHHCATCGGHYESSEALGEHERLKHTQQGANRVARGTVYLAAGDSIPNTRQAREFTRKHLE